MLGEKIRVLRKKEGLSQEQLAEQLNVSRQSVSKWETDKTIPDMDKLVSIAGFFNVSVDSLIQDTPEENKHEEQPTKRNLQKPRILLSVLGGLLLLFLLVILCFRPVSVEKLSESVVLLEIYDDENELVATGSGFFAFDKKQS